jgi:REase_DpnII-MboI
MVSMSNALHRSLANQLAVLGKFQSAGTWAFSPSLAFAGFVYKKVGQTPLFLTEARILIDTKRLDEAPILAAAGIAMSAGLWRSAIPDEGTWLRAFQRLQKRELFPVDRSSFAYRPLEVIGISLGLVCCRQHNDQQAEWLKDALANLMKAGTTNFWDAALYRFTSDILGMPVNIEPPPHWAKLRPQELALARWLGVVSKAFAPFSQNNFASLDEALLTVCLESELKVPDLAEAALLDYSLRQASRMRLKSAIEDTWTAPKDTQDAVLLVESICRRFPLFAEKLQKRHSKRTAFQIQDEYDVQDLMHALLQLHFDDVRPEETTPSHGGSSARMDFLLIPEEVVIEVKMTRKNLGQREITSQLAEDKERYKSHPHCRTLICFVYDPGRYCDKLAALEKDLSETKEQMRIKVIVTPKGI